jgi:hypothetical protein
MSDEFLEQFDPDDVAELRATAERVMGEDGVCYEMTLVFSAESANSFIDTYAQASEGDFVSMAQLMSMLYFLASSLNDSINDTEDD